MGIGTTVAGVVGTDTEVEVSRGPFYQKCKNTVSMDKSLENNQKVLFLTVRADFEVPLGVEKVCAVGVGSALGDSEDAGRGMEGAEGKLSSFERIEFARADVSLDEGIIAI